VQHGLFVREAVEGELAVVAPHTAGADATKGQRVACAAHLKLATRAPRDCQTRPTGGVQDDVVDGDAPAVRRLDHLVDERLVVGEDVDGQRVLVHVDLGDHQAHLLEGQNKQHGPEDLRKSEAASRERPAGAHLVAQQGVVQAVHAVHDRRRDVARERLDRAAERHLVALDQAAHAAANNTALPLHRTSSEQWQT